MAFSLDPSAGVLNSGYTGDAPPDSLMPIFQRASQASGVPLPILLAQAKQESNFNPNAVGKSGDMGVMQILPSTAQNPGFGMQGVDPSTLADPEKNIMFGAQYLAARAKANGLKDWSDPKQAASALNAYNGGGDPNYASNVMRNLGGPNPDMPAPGATAISGPLPPGLASLMANPSGQVPQQQPQGNTLGNTLMQIGGLMMAKGNPVGAQFLQTMLNNQRAQQKASTFTTDTQNPVTVGGKKYYTRTNDQTGAVDYIPDPDTSADEPDQPKPADLDRANKVFSANNMNIDNSTDVAKAANELRQAVADGKVTLNGWDRAKGFVDNLSDASSPEDEAIKRAEVIVHQAILQNVRNFERGMTTGKQLQAAQGSILPNGGQYSTLPMVDALDRISHQQQNIIRNNMISNESMLNRPGYDALANTSVPGDDGQPITKDSLINRWNGNLSDLQQFEKDYAPKRKQFEENYWKKNGVTQGNSGLPSNVTVSGW